MSKLIEKAKEHFENKDRKVIEVPEWGDDTGPAKIFAKPLTRSETSKLYKMSKDDNLTMMAYVLIYKALDENGDKLFDLGDKNAFVNSVDREILISVATQIMGQETLEETKKN